MNQNGIISYHIIIRPRTRFSGTLCPPQKASPCSFVLHSVLPCWGSAGGTAAQQSPHQTTLTTRAISSEHVTPLEAVNFHESQTSLKVSLGARQRQKFPREMMPNTLAGTASRWFAENLIQGKSIPCPSLQATALEKALSPSLHLEPLLPSRLRLEDCLWLPENQDVQSQDVLSFMARDVAGSACGLYKAMHKPILLSSLCHANQRNTENLGFYQRELLYQTPADVPAQGCSIAFSSLLPTSI